MPQKDYSSTDFRRFMNAGVGRGIELFEHFLRNMFAAEA